MGWVSPTGHSDPHDKWINEIDAYDGDLETYATGQVGSDANLAFILAGGVSATTYKIRIYCSDLLDGDVDEIEVYTLIDGINWIHYEGPVSALTWVEIQFNSLISITGIHIRKLTAGNWRLYEFQFWSGSDGYQLLASENYIVDNNNVPIAALDQPMQRKLVIGPNGRIHCVFRKCLYGGNLNHVYYAFSDDNGKTWTVENPVPALTELSQHSPSIAVDSSGNPHIVFQEGDVGRYVRRSAGGTWTLSNFYVGSVLEKEGGYTPAPFEFEVGDSVEGLTSGVTKTIISVSSIITAFKLLGFLGGGSGFIEGEWVVNRTEPRAASKGTYEGESGPNTGTSLGIMSSNRLVVASPGLHSKVWYWIQPLAGYSLGHALSVRIAHNITIDVKSDNSILIVSKDGNSYYDGASTLICTGTYIGAYPSAFFSIASDSDGNGHFVVAQTGLGGTYSAKLNIKYYKRIGSSWFGPTHITDINAIQANPSISIDARGRIHIMWQGQGWGTYPSKYSVLMQTYENGAWGATQVILNNDKNQGEYGPSLLHAWHPNSNRLYAPIYIFNRQGSWKIQFGGTFYGVGTPDTLLCEQTKNPTNVSDPQPEFSAIYRLGEV